MSRYHPNLTQGKSMTKIGYTRVSSTDQDTGIQREMLKQAGCTIIREEKVSGKTRKVRDELEAVVEFLHPNDVLVVTKLDRLGRNTRDVLNLVHDIGAKGSHLEVLSPSISTDGEMGKVLTTVLSMVAEMELNRLKERQAEGILAAKAKGVYKGGTRKANYEKVRELLAAGLTKAEVARREKISRETVYQIIRAM
jgi:DNA invertase Pin-like site-specific DNA recombinase